MPKNITWIKEYPTDELKEIATFTLLERGAYYSLKLIYHTNPEAFNSVQILFAMCLAFSEDERTAVRTVVERLFKQKEGGVFNERLDTLEKQAIKGIAQKSQAGIKSGEARRRKRTAVRTMLEPEPDSELEIERKQEKKEKKKDIYISSDLSKLENLSVDDQQVKDYVGRREVMGNPIQGDLNLSALLEQFRNHFKSTNGMNKHGQPIHDWHAAFSMWIERTEMYGQKPLNGSGAQVTETMSVASKVDRIMGRTP